MSKLGTGLAAFLVVAVLFQLAGDHEFLAVILSLPSFILGTLGLGRNRVEALVFGILGDWLLLWFAFYRLHSWRKKRQAAEHEWPE